MKQWYQSKTILANLLGMVGMLGGTIGGQVDPETTGAVVGTTLINIFLRFITKAGVE